MSKCVRLHKGAIVHLTLLTAPVAGIAGEIIAIGQGEGAADEAVATTAAPVYAAHVVAVAEIAAMNAASNAELEWGPVAPTATAVARARMDLRNIRSSLQIFWRAAEALISLSHAATATLVDVSSVRKYTSAL
jgi:hypothetical protein